MIYAGCPAVAAADPLIVIQADMAPRIEPRPDTVSLCTRVFTMKMCS